MATLVYNTRTGKEYPIHPSMANDPVWMATRGLIKVDPIKKFEATNMPATDAPVPAPAPKTTSKPK